MSKKRISGARHRSSLKSLEFVGVALAGGKTDKTCLATVEYFPRQQKTFLSRINEKVKTHDEVSADLEIHRLICSSTSRLKIVGFDVPRRLPKCLRCRLKCPGYEKCREPEILWMWKHYRELNRRRKPKKLFTPYTERCVEMHVAQNLEHSFNINHALGSNLAPLTARAAFISRRLKVQVIEVMPKVSLWRIGQALHVGKSHLLFHRHSVSGEESRRVFLSRLVERDLVFLYDQDLRTMVENNQAFEAFLVAFTAVLQSKGLCEPRPKGFPKGEDWISIPCMNLDL